VLQKTASSQSLFPTLFTETVFRITEVLDAPFNLDWEIPAVEDRLWWFDPARAEATSPKRQSDVTKLQSASRRLFWVAGALICAVVLHSALLKLVAAAAGRRKRLFVWPLQDSGGQAPLPGESKDESKDGPGSGTGGGLQGPGAADGRAGGSFSARLLRGWPKTQGALPPQPPRSWAPGAAQPPPGDAHPPEPPCPSPAVFVIPLLLPVACVASGELLYVTWLAGKGAGAFVLVALVVPALAYGALTVLLPQVAAPPALRHLRYDVPSDSKPRWPTPFLSAVGLGSVRPVGEWTAETDLGARVLEGWGDLFGGVHGPATVVATDGGRAVAASLPAPGKGAYDPAWVRHQYMPLITLAFVWAAGLASVAASGASDAALDPAGALHVSAALAGLSLAALLLILRYKPFASRLDQFTAAVSQLADLVLLLAVLAGHVVNDAAGDRAFKARLGRLLSHVALGAMLVMALVQIGLQLVSVAGSASSLGKRAAACCRRAGAGEGEERGGSEPRTASAGAGDGDVDVEAPGAEGGGVSEGLSFRLQDAEDDCKLLVAIRASDGGLVRRARRSPGGPGEGDSRVGSGDGASTGDAGDGDAPAGSGSGEAGSGENGRGTVRGDHTRAGSAPGLGWLQWPGLAAGLRLSLQRTFSEGR